MLRKRHVPTCGSLLGSAGVAREKPRQSGSLEILL